MPTYRAMDGKPMGNYGTLVYAGGREDNNLTLHELVHPEFVRGDGQDLACLGLQPTMFTDGVDGDKVVDLTADGVQAHGLVGAGVWPRGYGQLDPAVEG